MYRVRELQAGKMVTRLLQRAHPLSINSNKTIRRRFADIIKDVVLIRRLAE